MSRRVLVVDDDEQFCGVMARQLALLGCEPIVVTRSAEALDTVNREGPRAVLLDVVMPRQDGIATAKVLQRRRPDIPVILMSGYAEIDDVVEGMRAGARDFLQKPISRLALRDALDRAFEGDGDTPTPAPRPPTAAGEERDPVLARRRGEILYQIASGDISLPVPKRLMQRVSSLSEEENPDPEEIFELLESETLLAGAVLKLAGSPTFRGQDSPGSVREAMTRVGALRALGAAAAVLHMSNYRFAEPSLERLAGQLWLDHSLNATLAELIAEELGVPRADRLQTMTLFARVGELLTLRVAHQRWPEEVPGGKPTPALSELVASVAAEAAVHLIHRWGLAERYARFTWEFAKPPSDEPEFQPALIARAAAAASAGLLGRHPFSIDFSHPPSAHSSVAYLAPDRLKALERLAVARVRHVLGPTR